MTYVVTLLMAMLGTNIVLTHILGSENIVDTDKEVKQSFGYGLFVSVVAVLSVIVMQIIHMALVKINMPYLYLMVGVLVIFGISYGCKYVMQQWLPKVKLSFESSRLMLLNGGVVSLIMLVSNASYTFGEAILYAIGAGLGYTLILVIYAAIKGRYGNYDIPKAFRGLPIALITLGLIAIAFFAFAGMLS